VPLAQYASRGLETELRGYLPHAAWHRTDDLAERRTADAGIDSCGHGELLECMRAGTEYGNIATGAFALVLAKTRSRSRSSIVFRWRGQNGTELRTFFHRKGTNIRADLIALRYNYARRLRDDSPSPCHKEGNPPSN
jgi:hypothetical protein